MMFIKVSKTSSKEFSNPAMFKRVPLSCVVEEYFETFKVNDEGFMEGVASKVCKKASDAKSRRRSVQIGFHRKVISQQSKKKTQTQKK